jgi:triosephosphate isomerase
MKKLIIANWKMNPQTVEDARKLASEIQKRMHNISGQTEVVVCAPFVYLPSLGHYMDRVHLGAQNVSWEERGAFTGEISATMLKPWKVSFVILGHSERRLYLGETDSVVNSKIIACLNHKITPIVCLGGEEGIVKKEIQSSITKQFVKVTKNLGKRDLEKIVYVYEPTWAISTMKNSQPETGEHANQVIEHIYDLLEHRIGKSAHVVRVLYGGTVNKNNVFEYAKFPKIDGALVGAASLDPDNFWHIIKEFDRERIHKI